MVVAETKPLSGHVGSGYRVITYKLQLKCSYDYLGFILEAPYSTGKPNSVCTVNSFFKKQIRAKK